METLNNGFKKRVQKMVTQNSQKLIILLVLIGLYIFFSIFGNNFSTSNTLISIFNRSYYVGFLAIGVTFVIITGGIDLSIGAVMGSSALTAGFFFENHGSSCIPP